jgi:hypothetical protein
MYGNFVHTVIKITEIEVKQLHIVSIFSETHVSSPCRLSTWHEVASPRLECIKRFFFYLKRLAGWYCCHKNCSFMNMGHSLTCMTEDTRHKQVISITVSSVLGEMTLPFNLSNCEHNYDTSFGTNWKNSNLVKLFKIVLQSGIERVKVLCIVNLFVVGGKSFQQESVCLSYRKNLILITVMP